MASHIANKNTHIFGPAAFNIVFEQLILSASVVVEWVTDHIYPQVLIFHLLVIPPPQQKKNYLLSITYSQTAMYERLLYLHYD